MLVHNQKGNRSAKEKEGLVHSEPILRNSFKIASVSPAASHDYTLRSGF